MTRNTFLKLIGAGAASALTFMVVPGLAQTATSGARTPVTKKPTSATPRMIDEAIQRAQARAAKAAATGTPEQFGSEEPFTYVPARP